MTGELNPKEALKQALEADAKLREYNQQQPINNDRYLVNESGISELRQDRSGDIRPVCICYTPISICAIGHNIDTNEKYLEINFKDARGRDIKEWISFKTAFTRAGISELMNRGVVLPEGNAKHLNEFFAYMVHAGSKTLEEMVITSKNGWKEDNNMFVLGNTGYTVEGTINVLDADKAACAGLVPAGSLDEWVTAMKPILKYPKARFKFYACVSAPLLRLLGQQSFILDNYFESTAAKTTTSDAAMSMIGNPTDLKKSANSTKVGAERVAEQFSDLPVNLDETSTMKAEALQELVYMWANEKGKLRGKKDGGLQEESSWKSVIMLTGEVPITTEKSLTGAKIRVVELYGAIPDRIPNETGTANDVIKTNYGHVFPLYIREVLKHKDHLKDMYQEIRAKFCDSSGDFDSRISDTYATIALAGTLLENVFKDIGLPAKDAAELTMSICTEITERNRIERYSNRALDMVASWVASKEKYFIIEQMNANNEVLGISDEIGRYEIHGWIVRNEDGVQYIDIVPTLLRKFLEQSDIQPERCFSDWREAGIIAIANGRYTTTQRHDGGIKRVVRFKAEYLQPEEDTTGEEVLKYLSQRYDRFTEPTVAEELKKLRQVMQCAVATEFEDIANEKTLVDRYLFKIRKFKDMI